MARHGKYEYWLTDDGLTLLKGWARDGLNDEQIADKIGIALSTLYEWKNRFPEFSEALKIGKELPDYKVENALYQAAIDGNVTAQIFWLKNRRADKWRDKPVETSGPPDTVKDDDLSRSLKELAEGLESDDN